MEKIIYHNLYDKIDYWTMFAAGEITEVELQKLLLDYVQKILKQENT